MEPLSREFYLKDTLTVAKELLGKHLVHHYKDTLLIGQITETEAYIGAIDKACHAYAGRKTPRTETLYAQGGTAYVYFIYGMYYCMNVVTEPQGVAAAVLLRSVEIKEEIETASMLRYEKPYEDLSKQQIKNLSNGPGKLCLAMGITKEQNEIDLCDHSFFVTEGEEIHPDKIKASKRIGIEYAEEAKDFLWRFSI